MRAIIAPCITSCTYNFCEVIDIIDCIYHINPSIHNYFLCLWNDQNITWYGKSSNLCEIREALKNILSPTNIEKFKAILDRVFLRLMGALIVITLLGGQQKKDRKHSMFFYGTETPMNTGLSGWWRSSVSELRLLSILPQLREGNSICFDSIYCHIKLKYVPEIDYHQG